MKNIFRAFISTILLIVCAQTFALENSQAKDIRLNKAKLLILDKNEKEAFKLLNQNIKGDFHFDTIYFLVEYFYDQKLYLKSYRYLRILAKNSLSDEVAAITYNTANRDEYLDKLKDVKHLSQSQYSTLQYVSEKLYDFYLKKAISPEYLPFILSLAEQYSLICFAHHFRIIDTNYLLSKMAISRNNIPRSIYYILDAYEQLRAPEPPAHKVSPSELQTVLAEILIKDGLAETGALIMKSASLDENISPELKEYIDTYSDTIKEAFFNVIYDYQLKVKTNILQRSDRDEANGLATSNSLAHHNHLNIYYQTQLNKKYSLVGGLDLVNESALSQEADAFNFSAVSGDLQLKKYKSGNSLSSFNFKFDLLSGRDLPSLVNIQQRSQQVFTYESFWLTPGGKWQLYIPYAMKQFKNRNAMSIGLGFTYESFNRTRWFRLKYNGLMALQSEGESLGSTFYIDGSLVNHSKLYENLSLDTIFSYYKQVNSNEFLNYQQTALGLTVNYAFKNWQSTSLNAGFKLSNRAMANDTTYQMNDIFLGGKYNF